MAILPAPAPRFAPAMFFVWAPEDRSYAFACWSGRPMRRPRNMSPRAFCMNLHASLPARHPRLILHRRPSHQRQREDRATQQKSRAEFPPLPEILYRNPRQVLQKVKI